MRYDFVDFQLIANIYEAGTITKGAEASHITLASASERVRGMEMELGTELFIRGRRGVNFTKAGFIVLHHARLMLSQMKQMRMELAEYGMSEKGGIKIYCNTAAMSEYLPNILTSYLTNNSNITVEIEEKPSSSIIESIRKGLCDFGIISNLVDTEGLEVKDYCADPLVAIFPLDKSSNNIKHISLSELLKNPIVGLIDGSALQDYISQKAFNIGHHIQYRIRLRTFDEILSMVSKGIGVGIVPARAVSRNNLAAGIKMLELNESWAARRLLICAKNFEELPVQAKLLVDFIVGESDVYANN